MLSVTLPSTINSSCGKRNEYIKSYPFFCPLLEEKNPFSVAPANVMPKSSPFEFYTLFYHIAAAKSTGGSVTFLPFFQEREERGAVRCYFLVNSDKKVTKETPHKRGECFKIRF